ncbi:MAG TPA: AIR synthase related protein, partial [bacterium]|nr:AIR synthase related protein [bacterium]
ADKRWVFRRYDHMVQTNTVVLPGADAAVLRLKDAFPRGLALSADGNGRYCYLDPQAGGMLAVLEAAQNLACVGATPAAVTDCLNFASPERPEVFWTFREAIEGIAQACEALAVPVVGGNVSFYNEADGAIFPTPVIAMLGVLADVRCHATPGWKKDGHLVVLLGGGVPQLDGSEYLATVHGVTAGRLRRPDLAGTARLIECTREAVAQRLVSSAHDCADGGIAVALAECCIAGGRGARIAFALGRGERTDRVLFGEGIGRIVVSLLSDQLPALRRLAQRLAVPVQVLGAVGGRRLAIGPDNGPPDPWIDVEVDDLAAAAQWQVQAPLRGLQTGVGQTASRGCRQSPGAPR